MKSPTMSALVLSKQKMLLQNQHIREGRDSILANKDEYFVRLEGQSDDQYTAMTEMAPVYIIYPKIIDGFTGIVFSKSPNLTGIKEANLDAIENIDLLGNDLNSFSEKVLDQVFENGFCATYNDYSDETSEPFVQFVPASAFVSFRTATIDGKPVVSQFIYTDDSEVDDPENEFETLSETTFTVLDLVKLDEDSSPIFRVRVLTEVEKGESILKSESFPKMNGDFFTEIPIKIHSTEANNFTIKRSPLQDLSDMNISIMQRVVDQVYMLHWTALPTPWATGVDDDDAVTTIGPSVMLRLSSPESKVGMLEFSGSSASAHQDFIDNLKDIMASTGAQILKKEGVSRETATSVLVRSASQTSLVARLVNNVSLQMQEVFRLHLKWSGVDPDDDYSYTLNEDFIKVDMEPNAQIALVKSWIDGAISHRTLFRKMKEGELVDPNKTFEDELEDIKESPPPFFGKEIDAENAAKEAALAGSNLENENLPNKQATEQV